MVIRSPAPNVSQRAMPPRDPHEPNRVATPLELLFDLVTVIAIAAAAASLHHAIAEGHATDGIIRFALASFAIWWAWMNYTWFASAYDNGDTLFQVITMVIMAGALTVAAGIDRLFGSLDVTLTIIGYVVMRVGMVALWLRAARHDRERRTTTLRYAAGITVLQVYWVAFLVLQPMPQGVFYGFFILGGVLELSVPTVAERANQTPWHHHHITERYSLLNIIVLGEILLAASMALGQAAGAPVNLALVRIALSALIVVFAMWWLYFADSAHLAGAGLKRVLVWGYGHIVIFAAGASVGAGFAALVDITTGHAAVGPVVGGYAVAIPLASYLLGLWLVRDRYRPERPVRLALPVFGMLMVLPPLTPYPAEGLAVLALACVVTRHLVAAGKR